MDLAAKNVWQRFEVQNVYIGDCIHVYEEEIGGKSTYLGKFGRLVQENVKTVNDYYVIGLRSDQVGVYVPQLVIDKVPFEKLFGSSFTRVVDYFVMARNCIAVFPPDGELLKFQNERSSQPGYDEDNDEDVKFYTFNDTASGIHFDFVINFALQ